jgi:hypothetical protein
MDEMTEGDEALVAPQPGSLVAPAPLVHGLSDQKLRAVELLVAGVRPGVVAKRVGITRETLWRWSKELAFRQHLQRLRVEFHVARLDRMWALADRSLDVVEQHLDENDLQAATALLKLVRMDPTVPLPDGPEEPEDRDRESAT